MTGWEIVTGLAIAGLVAFDLQNGLAWWRGRVLDPSWLPPKVRDDDFTIVIPIYGHPRYFAERRHVERWKKQLVVCLETTPPAMEAFADELRSEGWRVFDIKIQGACAPRLVWEALRAGAVTTTYVVRLDGDSRPLADIGRHVAAMRHDGADLCSVKVHVHDPQTQAQRFQALEYRMSMLSRHFRPLLTSGACFIAKTEALRTILDRHTFWWAGEDVETGRIAHALRMRVRHLDMVVLTDAPETWRALYRQRKSWWAGNFRQSWVNFDKTIVHMPVWLLYYAALVWVGVFYKWYSLVTFPSWRTFLIGFAATWAVYVVVAVMANLQVVSWRMIVYPPYALLQAMLMPLLGVVFYVDLSRKLGSTGRYRFGYRRVALPAA